MRAVAEAAQRVLLRPVPDEVPQVQMAVRYVSASAAAQIGGDLYEVVVAGGNVRLIVGDVQGKGITAVQTAAAVLGAFRETAHDAPDLAAIAARLELSLERQPAGGEFVTAVLAQLRGDGLGIEILNCGHPPPLLLSGTAARFIEPADPGLPLGLTQIAVFARELSTVSLNQGERMLFYTDGISEARDRSGEFYRLDQCGSLLGSPDPGTALDRLLADVIKHVGHSLLDDAATLLICRERRDLRDGDGHAIAVAP